LTFVLRTELLGTSIRNALERAAVLVLFAVCILCASRETRVIRARAACAREALLRIRAGAVQAGDEALSVDADTSIAALEIELAPESLGRRVVFERIEA
jgi:hypothetical protein